MPSDQKSAKTSHFNFKDQCKHKKKIKYPKELITYGDDVCRSIISADDEKLVVHLSGAMSPSAKVRIHPCP
jgi:hypothetical protein